MRRQPFYVVWAENGGSPTYIHESYESARTEAERLARNNKTTAFHVLQSHSAHIVNDVTVVDLRHDQGVYDQIPF